MVNVALHRTYTNRSVNNNNKINTSISFRTSYWQDYHQYRPNYNQTNKYYRGKLASTRIWKSVTNSCKLSYYYYGIFSCLGICYFWWTTKSLHLLSNPYGSCSIECIQDNGGISNQCMTRKQYLPLPWITDSSSLPSLPSSTAVSTERHEKREHSRYTPLVCVVVTSYNVQDYIEAALESLFQQAYSNVHIIAVDDASTDRTTQIIQEYYNTQKSKAKKKTLLKEKEETRNHNNVSSTLPTLQLIQLLHNTNGGAGQPTNIGIESCPSETTYMMLLDGDDYMEQNAIQSMVNNAKQFNSDLVIADFDTFITVNEVSNEKNHKGDKNAESLQFSRSYDYPSFAKLPTNRPFNVLTQQQNQGAISSTSILNLSPVPWRKLYRYSLLVEHDYLRFPEGDFFYEDNAFHGLIMSHATRISKVDQVVIHHRRARKGNTSSNFLSKHTSKQQWWDTYSNMATFVGMLTYNFDWIDANLHRLLANHGESSRSPQKGSPPITKKEAKYVSFEEKRKENPSLTMCTDVFVHQVLDQYMEWTNGKHKFVQSKVANALRADSWLMEWLGFGGEYNNNRHALEEKTRRLYQRFSLLSSDGKWKNANALRRIRYSEDYGGSSKSQRNHPISTTSAKNNSKQQTTNIDLTLILSTQNDEKDLPKLLYSIYKTFAPSSLSFEVVIVDDGSSDSTLEFLHQFATNHYSNLYVLQTKASSSFTNTNNDINLGKVGMGTGRAYNRAIPLAEGKFVYFINAVDNFSFEELINAVHVAIDQEVDILMLDYGMHSKTRNKYHEIAFGSTDARKKDKSNGNKIYTALRLPSDPGIQLTSSKLLREVNAFFGSVRGYNNIQFHWTSIAAAKNIQFYPNVIWMQNKAGTRKSNVEKSELIDALGMTQRALARHGHFDEAMLINGGETIFSIWSQFCRTLLSETGSEKVSTPLGDREKRLLKTLESNSDPKQYRSYVYW